MNDPLQWILQRRKGNPRKKNSGWRSCSFCTTRGALLRCIREYCGDVEPAPLAKLSALPEHHMMQNLDVRGTDQVQAEEQLKPFASHDERLVELSINRVATPNPPFISLFAPSQGDSS